ncbi:MAG: hypothetical protein WKF57_06480 [Nakamurella sp.]
MSQYHAIVNLDAALCLSGHRLGTGIKLMEQASAGLGGPTTALALLLGPAEQHSWNGDRIAVIGDYAQPGELAQDVPFCEEPVAAYDLGEEDAFSAIAADMVTSTFGITYSDTDGWASTTVPDSTRQVARSTRDDGFFVVNTDTGEYLDPAAFECGRNFPAIALSGDSVMTALMILLAVSNERGGVWIEPGHPSKHLIGTWGGSRITIDALDVAGMTDISAQILELMVFRRPLAAA